MKKSEKGREGGKPERGETQSAGREREWGVGEKREREQERGRKSERMFRH